MVDIAFKPKISFYTLNSIARFTIISFERDVLFFFLFYFSIICNT